MARCPTSRRRRRGRCASSLDAVAREKSQLLTPAAPRVRTLVAGLETHVPLDAQRLLGFACGLHGSSRTSCARGPVKTAMEKEQTRERERYTRTIASRASGRREKKFPLNPLPQSVSEVRCRARGNVDFTGIMCGTTRQNVADIIFITRTHRNTRRRQGGGPWAVINHL